MVSRDLSFGFLLLFLIVVQRETSSQNSTYNGSLNKDDNQDLWRDNITFPEIRLGIIVEQSRTSDYNSALKIFKNSAMEIFQTVPVVLNQTIFNTPYETLRAVCDTFADSSVHGLVFVCEDPCAGVSTFVKLGRNLGWSGIRVYRSTEEAVIFRHAGKPSFFLDLTPPPHNQNEALLSLLVKFQWDTICVIHDENPRNLHLVDHLQERMSQEGFTIRAKISTTKTNEDQLVVDLKSISRTARVFVLYCEYSRAISVLEHASRLQLTDKEHAWIVGEMIVQKETSDIPASFPVGLIGIEYHREKDSRTDDIVDGMTALTYGIRHVIEEGLNDTPQVNCEDNAEGGYNFTRQLYKAIKSISFQGRTGLVSFTKTGERNGARYMFLNLRQIGNKMLWERVGYVENGKISLQQIVWPGGVLHTPSGLPRSRMRIVMYEVAPLLYVRNLDPIMTECSQGIECLQVSAKQNVSKSMCCYGLCIDLIKMLGRDIGFVPEIRVIKGGRAGSLAKGKWTGLIGEVIYGNADMAMSSISITAERSKYVDFSEPFLHTGSTILVARRHGSFKGDGFLKPFKVEVWLLIFGVLYLVAIIIFLFESHNPGLQRRKHKKYRGQFNIHQSIWLMFSRLFSGILNCYIPRFVSSRVVLSSWSFATLMIGALYTANLAAFMVLKEQAHYIDGINDSRIRNPSASVLKFATIRDTSVEHYFKNNFPHVFDFMRNYKFNHSSEGVEAVRDGTIDAFIWESATLERYVAKDIKCNLLTVGKLFDTSGFAAAFPKGSLWVQNVSEHILKYQQTNVQGELREKWQKGSCQQEGVREDISMGALAPANIAGVFYMLGAGVALSLVVMIGEALYCCLCRRTQRDWKPGYETTQPMEADDLVLRRETNEPNLNLPDLPLQAAERRKDIPEALDILENELSETLEHIYKLRQSKPCFRQSGSATRKSCKPFSSKSDEITKFEEQVANLTLHEARELIDSIRTHSFENRELGPLERVEKESRV